MEDTYKFPGGYDVAVFRKQDVLDCIDKNIIDKFLDINKSYIDIIYTIGFNEWPKNIFNIQLNIKDIK